MLKVFIPISPIAKARPRFTRFGHAYTPTRTRAYEKVVRLKLKELLKNEPVSNEPLSVCIHFFLKKGTSVKRKYPSCRPDLDNYAKAILDAMNEIVYQDDGQVINLTLSKDYGEIAGVEIKIDVIK